MFADHQLMGSKGSHWHGKWRRRQNVSSFPIRQSACGIHAHLLELSGF